MAHRLCIVGDCNKRPTFGIYTTDIYCKEHALGDIIEYSTMNKTTSKLCAIYRCKNVAEYNFKNCYEAVCKEHMISDLSVYKENILREHKTPRNCTHTNCSGGNKKAVVSYKKDLKSKEPCAGLFCKDCNIIIRKQSNTMIYIGANTNEKNICLEKKCKNERQFGTTSSGMSAICKECYEKSDKKIYSTGNKNKICKFDNCNVRASYNYDGDPAKFCVAHKEEDMINTDAKKCEFEGCITQPVFGYEGELAVRCKEHSLENMLDVRSNICDLDDCNTRACYKNNNNVRCSAHREDNMIFMYKSLKCKSQDCKKFASFGFKDCRPSKCYDHKEDYMLNLKNNKCSYEDCNTLASYGYEDKRSRERCSSHKLENMILLSQRFCINCKIITENFKYKPYCYQCFIELKPDHSIVREHKTKENAFTLKLKEEYQNAVLDKKIIGGCSSHRPDFILQFDKHVVIVEIDEHQHARNHKYKEEAEIFRLECLRTSLDKLRFVYIIRLNPDNYRVKDKLVKGCFFIGEDKRLKINEEEYNIRLEKLMNEVEKYVSMTNEQIEEDIIQICKSDNKEDRVKQIYLFYNTE